MNEKGIQTRKNIDIRLSILENIQYMRFTAKCKNNYVTTRSSHKASCLLTGGPAKQEERDREKVLKQWVWYLVNAGTEMHIKEFWS